MCAFDDVVPTDDADEVANSLNLGNQRKKDTALIPPEKIKENMKNKPKFL